ncbi:MAG: hypothetical protein S4CHLAM20_14770 [Chlamydiia bacterium]|nr:hypothetical protein [Chlamydiia bacterium]
MSYIEDELYPENYMVPVSDLSFYLVSLLCMAGMVYSERERIWRYLFYSPGFGMVESRRDRKTKKHQLTVETDIGKIKIPTLYHPDAQQIDIHLFQYPVIPPEYLGVNNEHVSYLGRKFITEQEFKQFSPFAHDEVEKHGNHFLIPIIDTDERESHKVSGFVKSLGSDHLLVFTIKSSHIDYQGLVMDYLLCLENLHQEINLDDLSDDEFASDAEEAP